MGIDEVQLSTADMGFDEVDLLLIWAFLKQLSTADMGIGVKQLSTADGQ